MFDETLGHSNFDALEDYVENFEIWTMIKEDVEDVNIEAHFLTIKFSTWLTQNTVYDYDTRMLGLHRRKLGDRKTGEVFIK